MRSSNRIFMFTISLCFLSIILPSKSTAVTSAYLIGAEGKVVKLDTDTNAVTNLKLKIPDYAEFNAVLGVDTVNNNLYVAHCARLAPCKVGIYGLKTLEFIKELPLISTKSDIQMLIYPDGSKFLINYLLPGSDGKEGGYTIDLYDAKTLAEIKNLNTFFGMYRVMLSKDGKKIYSIIGGAEAKVETIDSTTYKVLASKDLTQVWRKKPDVFGSRVESYSSGKILISENLKTEIILPDKLDFYLYDIESGATSTRISTGLQGDAVLVSDGTKIIFDENQTMKDPVRGWISGFQSAGRLHIYDVSTAGEIGLVSFQAKGKSKIKIRGIRPSGDRLYYQSEGDTEDTTKIIIMDIKNFTVITTINVPFRVLSMIFFEE